MHIHGSPGKVDAIDKVRDIGTYCGFGRIIIAVVVVVVVVVVFDKDDNSQIVIAAASAVDS